MILERDLPMTLCEDMLDCYHEDVQDTPKPRQAMWEMRKFHG